MSYKHKNTTQKIKPIPHISSKGENSKAQLYVPEPSPVVQLHPVKEESKVEISRQDSFDNQEQEEEAQERFQNEIKRFIEISKHFSSPIHKTASYICENHLVSFPNPFRIQYRRGGVTTQRMKFTNLTLEPVYIKLYKLIPELEQLKYINLSLARCKRIPPGLSFTLGFVYDDVNEKSAVNAKMVFVASRKTTTPCYQVCEVDLIIEALKIRLITV
ncbi:uncharacterized protein LOC113235442 [Hyposmocoma kahamanoa]|uniref:uncharacterized protein LOC113235442 n=1 Tax=Hyposmocoma kahamanoa TaxID=1477025 RepID=UPI000E6D71BA|nr:uncharacterized protein LOC113235442 [Hyposmocoma kahamanoa]